MTIAITTLAQAEINRRAAQRKTGTRIEHLLVAGKERPVDNDLRQLGGEALAKLVGTPAPVAAKRPAATVARKVAKARKTGVGSRGGDPRKAAAFAAAQATGAKVWSPDFRVAYRAALSTLVAA